MKKISSSIFALLVCLLFINIQPQFAAVASKVKNTNKKKNSLANVKKQFSLWQKIADESLKSEDLSAVSADKYLVFRLNKMLLNGVLDNVPAEFGKELPGKSVIMELPMPDGTLARFRIEESSVLDREMAARYPELKSYRGQGVDDASLATRFDWTPQGFHAMILTADQTISIEPANLKDKSLYITYYGDDLKKGEYSCLVKDFQNLQRGVPEMDAPQIAIGSTLRTFRLAIAATYQYTQAYGNNTVAGTIASFNTWVNGANLIYERELSIHLNLVDSTNVIYSADRGYTSATDPYNNTTNPIDMLYAVPNDLETNIGTANYDIGHGMGYLPGGASGVAGVGVACAGGNKGFAATLMGGSVGNSGTLGVWVHELGHELGADHNFNGTQDNCGGGNRSSAFSYESGSGSTIMGYPQICGADNIATSRDMRFHTMSYGAINNYIASYGTCSLNTPTGNSAPTLNGGGNYNIPRNTPFTLTATGSDPNGDSLTYNWEQIDAGGSSYPQDGTSPSYTDANDPSTTTRPIFRPYTSKTVSSRTFPDIFYILNYSNDPPDTLSGVQTAEELPRIGRTLHFRVTARDNRTGGGGVNEATVTLTVDNSSGPFLVTSPNTSVSVTGGTAQTVTWSVNNTNVAPVSAANVKISLSTDGGNTFPTVLLASTPNDGSQSVIIPNVSTTTARIKVEAVGNIFFDVSNTNFTIAAGTSGGQGMEADVASRPNGDGVIQSNDVVQVTRFVNELDTPSVSPNEFQRADSAPRTSSGDGAINSSDIVQTIRYLNELDATQSASGQTTPNGGKATAVADSTAPFGKTAIIKTAELSAPTVAPELRVESTMGSAGNQVSVNIRVDATGNEAQYAFAVLVDPNVLTFASFAAGGTTSQTFSCNGTATAGRVRCSIGAFTGNQAGSNTNTIGEIAPGNNQILIKVNFTVAANAQSNSTTAVNLGSQSASDDSANSITPAITNGTVTIAGATAAGAAISGRVLTAAGRGVANALVNLTDQTGAERTARTNGFGYYRFTEVETGASYTLGVRAKGSRYETKAITVRQDLDDLDFIPLSN